MRRLRRSFRIVGLTLAAIVIVVAGWLATGLPRDSGVLLRADVVPDFSPSARYRVRRATLTSTTGRTLHCLLRTPLGVDAPREATLLVAGGQGTGRRAVLLLDTAFTGTALACDYPWAALLRARGLALVWRLPTLRAEMVATPALLAIEAAFLASQPEADTTRLVGLGASLGVPPMAAWAARDARARAVALVYGGAGLDRVIEATFAADVPGWVPTRTLARMAGWALRPVEPGRTVAGIAPRPLLLVAGLDDAWMPRQVTLALAAAAREPKLLIWLRSGHMRPSNEALLRSISDTVRAWVKEVLPGPGDGPNTKTPQ